MVQLKKKDGAEMDWGSIIFQLVMFAFLIAFACGVFFAVKSLVVRRSSDSEEARIEKKLDRIIELLEKQNKE
jgi:large-conductance mechanosensitive channel